MRPLTDICLAFPRPKWSAKAEDRFYCQYMFMYNIFLRRCCLRTWAPFIRFDVQINQTVRGILECINNNQIKLEFIAGRKLWKQTFKLISFQESLECVIKYLQKSE